MIPRCSALDADLERFLPATHLLTAAIRRHVSDDAGGAQFRSVSQISGLFRLAKVDSAAESSSTSIFVVPFDTALNERSHCAKPRFKKAQLAIDAATFRSVRVSGDRAQLPGTFQQRLQ